MRTIRLLALCCAAVLLSCTESTAPTAPSAGITAAAAKAPPITVTDLGTLPGGTFSTAIAINAAGDIVGRANTGTGEDHAVLWHKGTIIDLGTLGGTYAQANAINPAGLIVGRATTSSGSEFAFLWDHGRMVNLGNPPGAPYSVAIGINASGQIVAGTEWGLATWQRGTWTVLPYPAGTTNCSGAVGIDNAGRVVGYCSMTETSQTRSFIWDGGVPTELAPLPGSNDVVVSAISPSGVAAGSFYTNSGGGSFLWEHGTMTELHGIGPVAINAAGQIAGSIGGGNYNLHAALWRRGTTIDLGTLPGGTDSYANGINAPGQVVGAGTNASGAYHALLWTLR